MRALHTKMQVQEQIPDLSGLPVKAPAATGQRRHNLQLLLANLKNTSHGMRGGAAIAFTSASGNEGVSHVTQLFAVEMARYKGRRTLVISAERLKTLGVEDYMQMHMTSHPTNIKINKMI